MTGSSLHIAAVLRELPTFVGWTCGLICGLLLVIAPFTRSGRAHIHVVRVACWLAGSCFVLWGAAGLVGSLVSLSPRAAYFLDFIQPRLGAAGFGVILLLFFSGSLSRS